MLIRNMALPLVNGERSRIVRRGWGQAKNAPFAPNGCINILVSNRNDRMLVFASCVGEGKASYLPSLSLDFCFAVLPMPSHITLCASSVFQEQLSVL